MLQITFWKVVFDEEYSIATISLKFVIGGIIDK